MTDPNVMSPTVRFHPVFYLCVDCRGIHLYQYLLCVYIYVHTQSFCVQNVQSSILWFPYLLFLFCLFLLPILSLLFPICPLVSSFLFLSITLSLSLTPLSMNFLPYHQQAKVRELEEKCRSQSEQFNLLSKELEKFRLQAGKFDILSTEPLTVCESPGSPNKSLSQLLNGLAAPIGKGMSRIVLMLRALKEKKQTLHSNL